MRRTDLLDTADWAHREMIRRARAMTPMERLHVALKLSDELEEMHKLKEERLGRKIPIHKGFTRD